LYIHHFLFDLTKSFSSKFNMKAAIIILCLAASAMGKFSNETTAN